MSENSASDVAAKLQYADLLRRVVIARANETHPDPVPLSWSEFEYAVRTQCGLLESNKIIVTYNDVDGDPIQIDTDEELANLANDLSSGELKSLKFTVTVQERDNIEDDNDFVMIPSPPGSDFDRLSQDGDIEEEDPEAILHDTYSPDPNPPVNMPEVETASANIDESKDYSPVEFETIQRTEDKGKGKIEELKSAEAAEKSTEEQIATLSDGGTVALDQGTPKTRKDCENTEATLNCEDNRASTEAAEHLKPTEASENSDTPATDEFEIFLNEVQPLIDQLLTKLESRPEFIPELLDRFNSSLNSRNWGLTVETPLTPVTSPTPSVQWVGVRCDGCGTAAFTGPRFKCLICSDFDLCSSCHSNAGAAHQSFLHPITHTFEKIDVPAKVWKGVVCDGCGRVAFTGFRHKCKDCYDFDFCEKCHVEKKHIEGHTFERLDPEVRSRDAHSCIRNHQNPLPSASHHPHPVNYGRQLHGGRFHRSGIFPRHDLHGHRHPMYNHNPWVSHASAQRCHRRDVTVAPAESQPVTIPVIRLPNEAQIQSNTSVETAETGTNPPPVMPGSFPVSKPSNESASYADVTRRGGPEMQKRSRPRYGIDIATDYQPYVNVGDMSESEINEKQEQLLMMGFENSEVNDDLLRTYNGEVDKVLEKLLEMEGSGL